MSKYNSLLDFPAQCYAVIGDRLCIVTRGEKGWKRAPINAENSAANHELAALKNKELGVTPEEAKLLRTGAILGWDAWVAPKSRPTGTREIFKVEISRPHSFCAATLELPAAWAEFKDAFDKVGITDNQAPYEVELLDSQLESMTQVIPKNANLFELNHLAERLSAMGSWELNCFEGLCMMDSVENQNRAIPVERLINMTHSLADCQVLYEVHDDESLGKFYVENEFVPELETLPEKIFSWLDYSKIGAEMRIAESGVFAPGGYVVQNGKMSDEYSADKLQKLKKPDFVFRLEIAAAPSGDEPNDERTAFLKLPATADDIKIALDKVRADSLQNCVFYSFESVVPQITEELFADMNNFPTLNELAEQIQTLEQQGGLTTYKAMLTAAPKDITLEDALDLSHQTDGFIIWREVCSPSEYARNWLAKLGLPLEEELCADANLYHYGEKLMERDNAIFTEYGTLVPLSSQSLEQCLKKQEQSGMCQSMT